MARMADDIADQTTLVAVDVDSSTVKGAVQMKSSLQNG